jgi:hypothetical protein
MTEPHFLIVTTDFKEPVDSGRFTKSLDLAIDWIRVMPDGWLLWTNSSADKWYSRLKQYTKPGNRIFICELNTNERSGYMPKSFWEFVNAKVPKDSET